MGRPMERSMGIPMGRPMGRSMARPTGQTGFHSQDSGAEAPQHSQDFTPEITRRRLPSRLELRSRNCGLPSESEL